MFLTTIAFVLLAIIGVAIFIYLAGSEQTDDTWENIKKIILAAIATILVLLSLCWCIWLQYENSRLIRQRDVIMKTQLPQHQP